MSSGLPVNAEALLSSLHQLLFRNASINQQNNAAAGSGPGARPQTAPSAPPAAAGRNPAHARMHSQLQRAATNGGFGSIAALIRSKQPHQVSTLS
jgi:hypothetical protein